MAQSGFCPATGIYRGKWDTPASPPPSSATLLSLVAAAPPEQLAFIEAPSGASMTYSQLQTSSASIAASLLSLGIRRGDVILVVSPNSILFPAVVLGIISIGAIFSPANFLHTREELQTQIQDCRPALVVATAELRRKLVGKVVLLEELLTAEPNIPAPAISPAPEETAALMYSSGTTGKSKAVICTHGNLASMSSILRRVWPSAAVYLCAVPLFHMFGFSVFLCGAMAAGSTVVVLRRYSLDLMLAAVENHRVDRLPAVPPIVNHLAKSPLAKKYDLGSLKEVISSGSPLSGEVRDRFRRSFPQITLSQCYGLTETSGPITVGDRSGGKIQASIGRLVPTVEAKICDLRSRKPLPPNKIGELCVRGPPLMEGYLSTPEATAEAIDGEGWLRTGDLCYIDERGLVYLVDRMKELIKYKGYQVAPAELEEILSRHVAVADVAVVPHPSKEAGEIPVACVVLREGCFVDEGEIMAYVAAKVAPYKKIRAVRFVDSIPRSPSGKILRRRLRDPAHPGQRFHVSPRL